MQWPVTTSQTRREESQEPETTRALPRAHTDHTCDGDRGGGPRRGDGSSRVRLVCGGRRAEARRGVSARCVRTQRSSSHSRRMEGRGIREETTLLRIWGAAAERTLSVCPLRVCLHRPERSQMRSVLSHDAVAMKLPTPHAAQQRSWWPRSTRKQLPSRVFHSEAFFESPVVHARSGATITTE